MGPADRPSPSALALPCSAPGPGEGSWRGLHASAHAVGLGELITVLVPALGAGGNGVPRCPCLPVPAVPGPPRPLGLDWGDHD